MTQARKCDVCRARKVKCDEKRPLCGPCASSGRPCKFKVADSIRFVKQIPAPECNWNETDSENENPGTDDGLALRTTRRPSQGNGIFHTFSNSSKSQREKKVVSSVPSAGNVHSHDSAAATKADVPMFDYSATNREQLKMMFLDAEFPPGTFLRRHLVTMYSDWFESRGKAMQLATDCVLLLSLTRSNDLVAPTDFETRRLYGAALEQLRLEIEAPDAAQDDGVLGTIEALTLIEQFQDKPPSNTPSACSWLTHFRGLERCFEVRGPSSLESSYARNLLLNAAPIMLINAVELRQAHFLGRPEWQQALEPYADNAMVRLILRVARLPEILVNVNQLSHIQDASHLVESATLAMREAGVLTLALKDWWAVVATDPWGSQQEQPRTAPLEYTFPEFVQQFRQLEPMFPFASPREFEKGLDAIHHTWYCICRLLTEQAMLDIVTLLLDRVPPALGAPRPLMKRIQCLTEGCNILADSICRAVPYLHSVQQVPYTVAAICSALMYANRWYEKYEDQSHKAAWCQGVRRGVEKVDDEFLGRSPHVKRHFSGWTLLIPTQKA